MSVAKTQATLSTSPRPMGGELEGTLALIPSEPNSPFKAALTDAAWYTSARGALAALLISLRAEGMIDSVLIPSFVCEAVLNSIEFCGLPYRLYPVDHQLRCRVAPQPRTLIVVVHYFGFVNPTVCELLQGAGEDILVVEDCAQALLTPLPLMSERQHHYRIFSPRKFLGVPAGGCLTGRLPVYHEYPLDDEVEIWKAWTGRLLKGLYRQSLNDDAEDAIEDIFVTLMAKFEEYLDDHPEPRKLPPAVAEILRYQDYAGIASRRRENYRALVNRLPRYFVPVFPQLPAGTCPLGCPILLPNEHELRRVRTGLVQQRIFTATHWPIPRQFGRNLPMDAEAPYGRLLTLPIDQRYGLDEMERIAWVLEKIGG